MGIHLTTFKGDVFAAIREAVLVEMPDARVEVAGGGGHFTIEVVSSAFEGKTRLESQRVVLNAIAHLMAGDMAPVHAVDSLKTRVP